MDNTNIIPFPADRWTTHAPDTATSFTEDERVLTQAESERREQTYHEIAAMLDDYFALGGSIHDFASE